MDTVARGTEGSGPTNPAELAAFLDGVMEIQLDEHRTAGAVVSVVKDGELFFARGYGYADWEERQKVDPEMTLFRIGSVTKLFVWTSVMQLVEEGVLDLDTDMNEYLKGIRIPDTYDEAVTLRHVMTHSAGFEDHVVGLFSNREEDLRPLAEVLAEQLPARVRPPGEVASYSNHATALAALVVQQVSGVPWDEFVQARILDPLGMEQASFAQPLPEELANDMSGGYVGRGRDFVEKNFEFIPIYPAGSASASGTAMAKFMIAHLQHGRLGDARILEEGTARRMHSELFRMAPEVNPMAHGFYEMSAHGKRIIGRGGDTFWFHSQLALFPGEDLGVFVSYNSRGGGSATGQFMEAFLDHYFPRETEIPEPREERTGDLDAFTGRFRANRFSHTTLAKAAAVATVSVNATEDGTLKTMDSEWIPVGPLTFGEKYGDRTLVFREGKAGEVTHMFRSDLPIMAFERVPWTEHPILHLVIAFFWGVMAVGTLVAWPLGWAARKWYGVKGEELERIPRRARMMLWLAAFLFLVGLVLSATDENFIAVEIPAHVKVLLLLPILGAGLTLLALAYAVRLYRRKEGRPANRFLYSATVISFLLLLWQLDVWNLLGWTF